MSVHTAFISSIPLATSSATIRWNNDHSPSFPTTSKCTTTTSGRRIKPIAVLTRHTSASLKYASTKPNETPNAIDTRQIPVVISRGITTTIACASLLPLLVLGLSCTLHPSVAHAVSGGGKDYASQNHSNETFHGDYTDKDFSGGLFRNCDFVSATLRSARFFKAELREADLSHADLSLATVEAAILRDTVFDDAIMNGTYISDSILDAASIRNVDFTDALITPVSVVTKLCERSDATGTNSVTGVSTRESLMCPE